MILKVFFLSVCWMLLYLSRWIKNAKSRDSSVGIALGYGLDYWRSRVRFPEGLGSFLFTTASRTALEPTQFPIQWVPGAFPRGKADHSAPSSAPVKNAWRYTSTPQYTCGRIPTFQRSMLLPSSEYCYGRRPTFQRSMLPPCSTTLHGVTTQKTSWKEEILSY
jgi:hypothetical protein